MSPFLVIDEEGYLCSDQGIRMDDVAFGQELFRTIERSENGSWCAKLESKVIHLEYFSAPLVARQVYAPHDSSNNWQIQTPYEWKEDFSLESLYLDEWDRFHGRTLRDIPFVLSRPAQASFFDLLESFTDDSIISNGIEYKTPQAYSPPPDANSETFWSQRYRDSDTPWDFDAPHPAFVEQTPKLKLNRSRVLVPGCGRGHDAHYFAQQGHIVSACDLSADAISIAQERYDDVNFFSADVFELPKKDREGFDVLVEHTLYCAIPPSQRAQLVDCWRQLLVPGGLLVGVFFCMDKPLGPPFGGTEWELRQRLKPHFDFFAWQRYRKSIKRRIGWELYIVARKSL